MGSARINVQLRLDAGTLQSAIHEYAVFGRADDVGPAVREENGRRVRRESQAGSQLLLVLGFEIAGIDRDREVRPAAYFVNLVDWLIGSLLETCGRGNRQMAARGETDNANAFGIDVPLFGFAAHEADRALGILEGTPGRLVFGFIGPSRHAIFEDDSRHALRSQPGSDLLAFQLPIEVPVAAAGTDEDRGSSILFLRRPINRDGGFADVGQQFGGLGYFDLLLGQLRRHADRLWADVGGLIWRFSWPDFHDDRLVSPHSG